jgi:hypothetical protein
MAHRRGRFDTDGAGGSTSFVMGRLSGTVLGAGLGMLFAPRAGSELRSQLTDQAGHLASQASEKYRRATVNAGEWVDGVATCTTTRKTPCRATPRTRGATWVTRRAWVQRSGGQGVTLRPPTQVSTPDRAR